MYTPPLFREDDPDVIRAMIRDARLCNLVTATAEGLMSTPLPLYLEPNEGEHGTLYGHLAKANPQWTTAPIGDALAIFMGPDAYITPSWYASKKEHGRVLPTWNYLAVVAYGPVEFFEDADRLLQVVSHQTDLNEQKRSDPWAVSDAPDQFVQAQLKGIVGLRMPIRRIEGKRKMNQNRPLQDRRGVVEGLAASSHTFDQAVSRLISLSDE